MSSMFSDTFDVTGVDRVGPNGAFQKVFDKVSRIKGKSENYDTELDLDVNSEIYPVVEGDKIEILLAEQLRDGEGPADDDASGYDPTIPLGDRADQYEYVMSGRIFKFSETRSRAVIYMSFGGLMLGLTGEPRILSAHTYKVDSRVYLFVRKV